MSRWTTPARYVAVDHAGTVGVLERLARLVDHAEDAREIEQRARLAIARERLALDQLHGEVVHLVVDPGVENRHDVRMAQLAGERRLVLEEAQLAPRRVRVRRQRLHHLERDVLLVERIGGDIDGAGRALAEQPLDLVLADALGRHRLL
jgi:hypothetical protein